MNIRGIYHNLANTLRVARKRYQMGGRHALALFVQCAWNDFIVKQANKRIHHPRFFCPCCGWSGFDFLPLDAIILWERRISCPRCLSQSRQRFLHEYLTRYGRNDLAGRKTVLHFAPEKEIGQLLNKNPDLLCIGSDLARDRLAEMKGKAFRCDIIQIPLADETIDLIVCLHVLEHLRDDRAAIAELHRVMRKGAVAYIMVPISVFAEHDVEFQEPDARDHYRYGGRQYGLRLKDFEWQEIHPKDFLSKEEQFRLGSRDFDIIYRCVKRG